MEHPTCHPEILQISFVAGQYIADSLLPIFPQSNGRAETAVKSMKRLVRGHTGARGSLDTAAMTLALLQYRNTPMQNAGGKSPAQLALGRELKDYMPLPKHLSRRGAVVKGVKHLSTIVLVTI